MRSWMKVDVGIIFCGTVREYLEAYKLLGMDIEWREGNGWLSRQFTITGDVIALKKVKSRLEQCLDI